MRYRIKETGVIVEQPDGSDCLYPINHPLEPYSKYRFQQLGLTLEEIKPEPRKLYAYTHRGSTFIIFRPSDDTNLVGEYIRAPEYDIVYGEEK